MQKIFKKKIVFQKSKLNKLPETPGVYIFLDKKGSIIYIGKAKNLKKRVASYFSNSLGVKTSAMVRETHKLSYIRVNSELESLLLEAKLIKKYKPRYNLSQKDDKKPLYIKITNDKYPKVVTARKIDEHLKAAQKPKAFYGPFPSARNVKVVLRMLKKNFKFSEHKISKRACVHSQIGLCDPCPSYVESLEDEKEKENLRKKYLYNIRSVKGVLDGRIPKVRKDLVSRMNSYSKHQKYEEALMVKKQIDFLDYIIQPIIPVGYFIANPNLVEDIRATELVELKKILYQYVEIDNLSKIECFDVAHIAGTRPTASMVTFIEGEPDKSLYRHFRIRQKRVRSDTDSLKETIIRRSKYFAVWGTPDLIVVDGGKGQVSTFFNVLKDYGIPIVGLAKREETLVIPVTGSHPVIYKMIKVPKGPAKNLLQRLRDEAHRFARNYHHKLLKRDLLR